MEFGSLLGGIAAVITPTNLAFALLGCVLGMLVGVLPGFGPAAAVSLLIPVTFGLSATTADHHPVRDPLRSRLRWHHDRGAAEHSG